MRKAIVFTAHDRLRYLQATLESWYRVRALEQWDIIAVVDPGQYTQHVVEEFEEWAFHRRLVNFSVKVNPVKLGVLASPYYALDDTFDDYFDFVVRAEDDLLVSGDILEYFTWAASKFEFDPGVGNIGAWSDTEGPENAVRRGQRFNPLVWGTWKDRWDDFIGPTWDIDYSTNNGTPGVQAGWDWNLNREYDNRGLVAVNPLASRVQNIGVVGTHATPENFVQSPSFSAARGFQKYELVR